jgi:hypothetical protein
MQATVLEQRLAVLEQVTFLLSDNGPASNSSGFTDHFPMR